MHYLAFYLWSSLVFFLIIIVCVISRLGTHTYNSILSDIKRGLCNSLKFMFIKLKTNVQHI